MRNEYFKYLLTIENNTFISYHTSLILHIKYYS